MPFQIPVPICSSYVTSPIPINQNCGKLASNVNCFVVLHDNSKCQQFECCLVVCTIKPGCSLARCVTQTHYQVCRTVGCVSAQPSCHSGTYFSLSQLLW